MKDKKVKHARPKITQEQVDAMNRQLELARSANYRYAVDEEGRLTGMPCLVVSPKNAESVPTQQNR